MERVGGYELVELIGQGGMGEVWRAHDLERRRDVALKLLPASLTDHPEYQHRFRRESHIVARLREPHLIPIHDYGEIDGRLFIDMRLVEGRSLHELLHEEGRLTAPRTVALLSQIADALDAAHADGLVHRDVKPSNVLVTANDFVYVVDFGLAFAVDTPRTKLTMTGTTVGTLEYMAPERFSDQQVDMRTDVYSLACVLFECLTREKPFPGDLPTQMYGHLNVDPPRCSERCPEVPPAFDAVVARGMAKDPEDRFATAGDMVLAAREALRRSPRVPACTPAPTATASPARTRVEEHPLPAAARTATASTVVSAAAPAGHPAPVAGHRRDDTTTAIPFARTPGDRRTQVAPPHPSGPVGFRDPHPSGPAPGGPLPDVRGPVARRRSGLRRAAAVVVVVVVLLAVAVVLMRVGSGAVTRPAPVAATAQPTVVGTVPVGPSPVAAQVAPDGSFAYIADRDARAITVLDTVSGAVTGTIPVPEGGPQTVTFSPDGRQAYVGMVLGTGGEVAVIDTSSGSVTARVPTGSAPAAVAVGPDGQHVYASVSGGVLVIDAPTATVVGQLPVAEPHGLAFSPDGRRLAVTDFEAGAVTVFDIAEGRPLTTVPVGRSPHAIAWDPSRPLVFVGNYGGNSVSVLDVDAGDVVATVSTAVHPQAVTLSADGRYVYVAAIDAHVVQVLDATTFRVTATVPTGRGPSSVAVAPDGRRAWVTDLLDGTVTALDVAAT